MKSNSKEKKSGDALIMLIIMAAGFVDLLGILAFPGSFITWREKGFLDEWWIVSAGYLIILAGLLLLFTNGKKLRIAPWIFLLGSVIVFIPGLHMDMHWILGAFFLLLAITSIVVVEVCKPYKNEERTVEEKTTPTAAVNQDTGKESHAKKSGGKLARPKFSKDETFALGNAALSLISESGRPDTDAEVVILSELDDFSLEDVKQLYMNLLQDQARLALILHQSCAYDPFKKMYAAGFLAKVVHSRSDGGTPQVIGAWEKAVKNIIRLDGIDSLEDGVRLYDEFEHGKGPENIFAIFAWLSQIPWQQH